ncbi:MAG TPA: hypothetical protein VM093_06575 [Aeromicrobium sp.]|nr:hypothetical protein [Aeromicrobium sp.]
MTEPKFPWALLVMIAMFTFIAISAKGAWMVVFAVIAVLLSSAAAIYQLIPRRDDSAPAPVDADDDATS